MMYHCMGNVHIRAQMAQFNIALFALFALCLAPVSHAQYPHVCLVHSVVRSFVRSVSQSVGTLLSYRVKPVAPTVYRYIACVWSLLCASPLSVFCMCARYSIMTHRLDSNSTPSSTVQPAHHIHVQ